MFRPFEVNVPHLAYTILGAFVVIFGMFSLVIKEKAYIGEAPIATVIGIIMGPYVTGLFDPNSWGGEHSNIQDEITLEVTRVIIAVSVFAVGVELPKAYMWRHWRSLAFLLGPAMIWGWMISGLLMWALIPGLNFLSSLVIAAAVTPTDPILAQAVIGGKFADKHVPAHVRHMLSAESGSNDGAAFPFLGIALYLTLDKSPGHAVGHWFYYTIAYEIILGIILGALLGWVARKVMKFSEAKRLIDRQSYVAQYVSLAILSIGFTSLLGSDDLLSAFACGCAFAWDGFFNKATEDAEFSNVIDLLFNCAAFIYIGAIIPFDSWNDPKLTVTWWRLLVLAILILFVRRLPSILAMYKFMPDIKTFREALFVGWFGPMGVGAIFIGTLAKTSLPEGEVEKDTEQVDLLRELIMPVITFLVLASIITHGLSIPFFSLGRRVHSITYTWSRNPSMDTRGNDEPAWTTHARRILPGQEVRINRDDDAEEGDLGLRGEKMNNGEGSNGSSDSRTLGRFEEIEMGKRPSNGSGSGSGSGGGEEARGEEIIEPDAGERTPPLAEYREGHHLIIERRRGSGDEVDVEVVRNAFNDEPSKRHSFIHPHRLEQGDIDGITSDLARSLSREASHLKEEGQHLKEEGKEALHKVTSGGSRRSQESSRSDRGESSSRPSGGGLGDFGDFSDSEDEDGPKPYKGAKPPKIKLPGSGGGGIRGWFSRRSERSPSPTAVEEGRSSSVNPSLLSPPLSPRGLTSSPRPISGTSRHRSNDSESSQPAFVDASASTRNTRPIIRFADDSQPSEASGSGSGSGPGNYGNAAPGFRRNPALAMYRTQSVQSQGNNNDDDDNNNSGPSVSFKEPKVRR